MRALARFVSVVLLVIASAACGDDDASADAGAVDTGTDVGPMCIDPGQGCSFTPCCEGFCCCVAVGDAASCAYTCVADRMGTCR